MDIASVSTALSNVTTANSIGTAVLAQSLDQSRLQGQMMAQSLNAMPSPSLEVSVNPSVGSNFDVSV